MSQDQWSGSWGGPARNKLATQVAEIIKRLNLVESGKVAVVETGKVAGSYVTRSDMENAFRAAASLLSKHLPSNGDAPVPSNEDITKFVAPDAEMKELVSYYVQLDLHRLENRLQLLEDRGMPTLAHEDVLPKDIAALGLWLRNESRWLHSQFSREEADAAEIERVKKQFEAHLESLRSRLQRATVQHQRPEEYPKRIPPRRCCCGCR